MCRVTTLHDDPVMNDALLAWTDWAYLEFRHDEAWAHALKGRVA
jgi:hypothetical protein